MDGSAAAGTQTLPPPPGGSFRIDGAAPSDRAGWSVAGLGPNPAFDGDGPADLLVGAPFAEPLLACDVSLTTDPEVVTDPGETPVTTAPLKPVTRSVDITVSWTQPRSAFDLRKPHVRHVSRQRRARRAAADPHARAPARGQA